MSFFLASDDAVGFAVKRADVEALHEPIEFGGVPARFVRLTVDDWNGRRVEGVACDRFGDAWAPPRGGIPRYIRFWLRGSGETVAAVLARARAGEPTFSWYILCEDLPTADRFRLAG